MSGRSEGMGRLKNPGHEAFCRLFVLGNPAHDENDPESPVETIHNATRSYELAGYKARGNAAAVNGSRLLRRPDIQKRVGELREEAENIASTRIYRWRQLLPRAQEVLARALAGEEVSTQALQAAKEVVLQAGGPPSLRFRDPKSGKDHTAVPIYVLGVDDEE
jgi:hypothetical protein